MPWRRRQDCAAASHVTPKASSEKVGSCHSLHRVPLSPSSNVVTSQHPSPAASYRAPPARLQGPLLPSSQQASQAPTQRRTPAPPHSQRSSHAVASSDKIIFKNNISTPRRLHPRLSAGRLLREYLSNLLRPTGSVALCNRHHLPPGESTRTSWRSAFSCFNHHCRMFDSTIIVFASLPC